VGPENGQTKQNAGDGAVTLSFAWAVIRYNFVSSPEKIANAGSRTPAILSTKPVDNPVELLPRMRVSHQKHYDFFRLVKFRPP
jgi:hypothetical protein